MMKKIDIQYRSDKEGYSVDETWVDTKTGIKEIKNVRVKTFCEYITGIPCKTLFYHGNFKDLL